MGARSPDRSRVARVWPNRHVRRSLGAALAIAALEWLRAPRPAGPRASARARRGAQPGRCVSDRHLRRRLSRHPHRRRLRSRTAPPVAAANNFDTLIRLDCEGRPIPGLASSWTRDSTGSVWTFVLPDSTAPGALDLASAWNSSDSASAVLEVSGVKEAVPDDERQLVVTLEHPSGVGPVIFADHSLGLRASRRHAVDRGPAHRRARRARSGRSSRPTCSSPAIPTVLDYASKRPGTVLTPLPWDRVYVLLHGARGSAAAPSSSPRTRPPSGRSSPATRCPSEARPAKPPYWWSDLASCSDSATRVPMETGATSQVTIGYLASDPAARALAERIVALGDSSWFARGLATHDFETALKAARWTRTL